jgi:hypothetical protein
MLALEMLHRIFRCPPGRHTVAQRRPARRCRSPHLALEILEDRTLLSVSLVPDQPASQVGAPVTWTATADAGMAAPVYQFSVGPVGGSLHMVQDFSSQNSFTWDPMQEGNYQVQVAVKDGFGTRAPRTPSRPIR